MVGIECVSIQHVGKAIIHGDSVWIRLGAAGVDRMHSARLDRGVPVIPVCSVDTRTEKKTSREKCEH